MGGNGEVSPNPAFHADGCARQGNGFGVKLKEGTDHNLSHQDPSYFNAIFFKDCQIIEDEQHTRILNKDRMSLTDG